MVTVQDHGIEGREAKGAWKFASRLRSLSAFVYFCGEAANNLFELRTTTALFREIFLVASPQGSLNADRSVHAPVASRSAMLWLMTCFKMGISGGGGQSFIEN